MAPLVWLNWSQIDCPRPPPRTTPSIWYAAVAAPQIQSSGKISAVDDIAGVWQSFVPSGADRRAVLRENAPGGEPGPPGATPDDCFQPTVSSFLICSIVASYAV